MRIAATRDPNRNGFPKRLTHSVRPVGPASCAANGTTAQCRSQLFRWISCRNIGRTRHRASMCPWWNTPALKGRQGPRMGRREPLGPTGQFVSLPCVPDRFGDDSSLDLWPSDRPRLRRSVPVSWRARHAGAVGLLQPSGAERSAGRSLGVAGPNPPDDRRRRRSPVRYLRFRGGGSPRAASAESSSTVSAREGCVRSSV